ncbi:MAG: cation:proton antiporter [Methylomonas sp.]|nr:cation:proton antiporter [Methylomonas sp.]
MSITETFCIALTLIHALPYLIWRLGRTDFYAPLVVIQISTGIALGPGVLGKFAPDIYRLIFNEQVIQSLSGIAWWAVMLFVWLAGIELNMQSTWTHRRETGITALLALGMPLLLGAIVAAGLLLFDGWMGTNAASWQFILGIGMSCAVTALPILMLLMDKMNILRQPLGQRILRYASVDDIAIWGVLAFILMDWERAGRQLGFLLAFSLLGYGFRKLAVRLPEIDRWYISLIWLAVCGFSADWCGLHFMVGAFLAGVVMDGHWFDQDRLDALRHHVLLIIMPVFFLSTGLKTNWSLGGYVVLLAAAILLFASIAGKWLGIQLAGKFLNWPKGEASVIAWLLQTKALIMIIFANVLLDKLIISSATFTALLFMAVASTMLTVPMATTRLRRIGQLTGT